MALVHGPVSTRHPAETFAALAASPKNRFRKPRPHIHPAVAPPTRVSVLAPHDGPGTTGGNASALPAYGLAPRYWRRQMAGEMADEQPAVHEPAAAFGETGETVHLVDEVTEELRHRIHDAEIAARQQARDERRGRLLLGAVVVLTSVAVAGLSPWLWR